MTIGAFRQTFFSFKRILKKRTDRRPIKNNLCVEPKTRAMGASCSRNESQPQQSSSRNKPLETSSPPVVSTKRKDDEAFAKANAEADEMMSTIMQKVQSARLAKK